VANQVCVFLTAAAAAAAAAIASAHAAIVAVTPAHGQTSEQLLGNTFAGRGLPVKVI
jgi:hypothetical protein